MNKTLTARDYSLLGKEAQLAVANGLSDATWYKCPVPREEMNKLLERKDTPAIIDTFIWFGLIIGAASLFVAWWPNWYAWLPYLIYCALYAGSSDSRWHESSHGTAFKTDWMNNALYEVASFMVFRQSVPWRWSHTRHHSDTIIRGRDPEIAVPRPPDIPGILLQLFALKSAPAELRKIIKHAFGTMDPATATYIPENEHTRVFLRARIYLTIYVAVIASSLYWSTAIPFMLVILPTLLGSWLMVMYGMTQHAGLAENVLDHRLNCRTVYMNRLNRFLYWNMNYHLEHHMFPLVPYHNLPKLHRLVKEDCPPVYPSILAAYQEIIPTLIKQVKDPTFHVKRILPKTSNSIQNGADFTAFRTQIEESNWLKVCAVAEIPKGEIRRLDFEDKTLAIYHLQSGQFFASDGICTHGNAHLADGMIIGNEIECPKHNGRFDIRSGKPTRLPVCMEMTNYPVKIIDEQLLVNLKRLTEKDNNKREYEVISNENVGTYIKELRLKPINGNTLKYSPGDYVQLEIPKGSWKLTEDNISTDLLSEYDEALFQSVIHNDITSHRNYSLASNPAIQRELIFNVRLALPPPDSAYSPGTGSSYVFQLKPNDRVVLKGFYGDFHIRNSDREMIYIGGGAGMAPLKSHISHLFDTLETRRNVTFWYGARSLKDAFYLDYFEDLQNKYSNFRFQLVISEESQGWSGSTGFVHEEVGRELTNRSDLNEIDYYLCGPPAMINATRSLLNEFKISADQIMYDEF